MASQEPSARNLRRSSRTKRQSDGATVEEEATKLDADEKTHPAPAPDSTGSSDHQDASSASMVIHQEEINLDAIMGNAKEEEGQEEASTAAVKKKRNVAVKAKPKATTTKEKAKPKAKVAKTNQPPAAKKRKAPTKEDPRKLDPEEEIVLPAAAKRKKTEPKKRTKVDNNGKKQAKPLLTEESVSVASKPKASTKEGTKAATMKKIKAKVEIIDADAVGARAGQSDGNGGLDQGATFVVEYAKTARATCKRCDLRIKKNELRIGHRPLFRGKPGYQIFKHLNCIVFTEEVKCAEDVAGHDTLEEEDYNALAKRVHESFKEIQKESEELEPDELLQKKFDGEYRPKPKGLVANLLPFQEEGLSWMYCQETTVEDVRGGILADEMGMGKTVQMIATILDNRPKLQQALPGGKYPACANDAEKKAVDDEEALWAKALKEWKHEMKMSDVHESILPKGGKKGQPNGGARAGTLVVCPVIALTQWKSEIEKFCERNALSICTYHGSDRVKNTPRALLTTMYDIVLTTYQVLEADFRKMVSPNKVKCPNCGAKFKVDKLRIHLKYFCGEGAQRTEAQSRTIRNSDRSNNNNDRRPGGNRGGRGGNADAGKGKKENAKKSMEKGKKLLKLKTFDDYASESDLSIADEVIPAKPGKSPRGAAAKARTNLRTSATKDIDSDSDDDFSMNSGSGSDSSQEEDSAALKKAKAKQAQALKQAKSGKKSFSSSKMELGKKKAEKKQFGAKGKGSKKGKKSFDAGGNDGSDDSSDSSDSDIAPEDDIDMDALVAEAMAGASMSVLHSVCWWRVVLDEAHFIKSRNSQTSHAAFALTGIHRWALSGTPLQNRVGEFYSLIRFLRLDPMAHYMCRAKDCNCKQVHYRMMHGRCKDCGHGSVQHYSHFNKHILNPIQRDGYSHDGRRAMFVLKNEVLDKCLLRRTKETRAEDMNLPPRIVTIKAVRLHPVEEDFYNALYTQTTSQFNDYVTGGTMLNNYAHIFDLLMRMRQSVDHPYLVVHSKKGVVKAGPTAAVTNGRVDCHLCDEPPTDRVVSTCCESAFCKSCVLEYMESAVVGDGNVGTPCPQCNNPFSIDLNRVEDDPVDIGSIGSDAKGSVSTVGLPSLKDLPHVATGSILRRIDLTKFATSTKIEALTQELIQMRKSSPGSKAIVFSQFVNMLDLIRWRLHSDPFLSEIGLGVRALHGGMDIKSRDAALKDFREDPNVRVLLMSLKAGGVALNLTVANYIYLMDPWWNPAAELQAIDRTHRLGQYRPIRAVRFIAENTVEERILQLQEKKRLVFDGTVGRDAGSLKMLTADDMKSLFA